MTSLSRRRLAQTVPFVSLTLAVAVRATRPVPEGPWAGIYTHYPLYWMFVGFGCASMIVAIHRHRLSWSFVGGFSILLLFTVVSHSLLWAPPWGPRDPWRHLGDVRDRRLALSSNVYPLFHVLVIAVSVVTGLEPRTVLSGLMLFVAVVGFALVAVVVRRVDADRAAQQTATIAALPGLFVGFVPRPFSLAYPFLLLGFWSVQSDSTRSRLGIVPALVTIVLIHPLVAALVLLVLFVAGAIRRVGRHSGPMRVLAPRRTISTFVLVAIGLEIAYLLFVASGFADQLLIAIAEALSGADRTDTAGPAGVGLISEALSSRGKFIEFLSRASFLLSLAAAATIALLGRVRRRSVTPLVVVTTVSGLVVLGLFLLLAFVPAGIGVTRLFVLAPLLFVPLLPYAFEGQTTSARAAAVGLALLVVTTGLLTGFLWPGIGGVEYSATEPQMTGVDWAVTHGRAEIVGTQMTHWIITGVHGRGTSVERSVTTANGMLATKLRTGSYSWKVIDRPSGALYVVDGAERARARQTARESTRRPLRCLRVFRSMQTRVYSNGDTNIYLTSRRPTCGVAS